MRPLRCTTLFLVGLAVTALGLGAPPARAVTVAIAPSDTTVNLNDEFWVRATLDVFPSLKGCDLIWGYSSPVLSFLAVQAGDAIAGGGGSYFDVVLPDVTAPADSVWYNAAVLTGSGSGPGVIVLLKFKAIAVGTGAVSCLFADLRDSNNTSTHPACSGGVVHVLGPVPARPRSWGRIKTLYR
jgi:hypothetical protein